MTGSFDEDAERRSRWKNLPLISKLYRVQCRNKGQNGLENDKIFDIWHRIWPESTSFRHRMLKTWPCVNHLRADFDSWIDIVSISTANGLALPSLALDAESFLTLLPRLPLSPSSPLGPSGPMGPLSPFSPLAPSGPVTQQQHTALLAFQGKGPWPLERAQGAWPPKTCPAGSNTFANIIKTLPRTLHYAFLRPIDINVQ